MSDSGLPFGGIVHYNELMRYTDKKYIAGEYCAQHLNPVWREKSDFIILAFLETKENHNHWEQMWAKKTGENRFILCCIPLFTYGLNLGDEVACDSNHQIQSVIKGSGNLTYRIWLKEVNNPEVKAKIEGKVREVGGEFEWSSENLLAVSIPGEKERIFEEFVSVETQSGLIFERGSTAT